MSSDTAAADSAEQSERWRKNPSNIDYYITLIAAPGFHDKPRQTFHLRKMIQSARVENEAQRAAASGNHQRVPLVDMRRMAISAQPVIEKSQSLIDDARLVTRTVAEWVAKNTWARPENEEVQGINLLVWGEPGHGKTKTVEEAFRRLGYVPKRINLATVAPWDVQGVPIPIKQRGGKVTTRQAAPEFFIRAAKSGQARLLGLFKRQTWGIDYEDLTTTQRTTQGASLSTVDEKEIPDGRGGFYSIRHCPQVATANYSEQSTVAQLLAPMADRWVHFVQTPDQDAEQYILTRRSPVHVDVERAKHMREHWDEHYDRAWALVAAYVREYKGRWWDPEPQDFDDVKKYAWTTSRTLLEGAARVIAACEYMGIDDKRALEGAIGVQGSRRLMDFRKSLNLPSVQDVFDGKVDWSKMGPSGHVILLQKAASECADTSQLHATMAAIDGIRRLSNGSDDLVISAVDTLRKRARGVGGHKPMDHAMSVATLNAFPANRAFVLGETPARPEISVVPDPTEGDYPDYGLM